MSNNLAYQMIIAAFLQSSSGTVDAALNDARYKDLTWGPTSLITPDMDVTGFSVGAASMTTREKNTVFDLDLYGRVEAGPLTAGDITLNLERAIDANALFAQTQALTDVDQPQLVLYKMGKLKSVSDTERIYDIFYTVAAFLSGGDGFSGTAKEVITSDITFKQSGTPTIGIETNNQTISWNPSTKTMIISQQ